MGVRLEGVRIHTDQGDAVRKLGGEAAAVGQHIYVTPEAFKAGTREGDRVLGEELVHVAQAHPSSSDERPRWS